MEDCVINSEQRGNTEPSTELKSQLNVILSELSNLKEAVHGTNLTFASEVKKLKTEKDLKWRFQGNKVQFDFNSDLADSVKQCIWAINNGKLDHCKEELEELSSKLHKRNKLVRIADSSTGGWDTVRQYEANPVASDSEDESKIHKAEGRALKLKRSSSKSRGGGPYNATSTHRFSAPVVLPPVLPQQQFGSQPTGRGRGLFRSQFTASINSVSGNGFNMSGMSPAPGPCYACGEYSNFRRNCPYTRQISARASTEQATGGQK